MAERTPELVIEQRTRLRLFQREVARQCRFGLIAAGDLVQALRRDDPDRAWYSIQGLLVAAANVSKLLWPNEKDEKIPFRGEILRQTLGIFDDSPLASRELRNHFEHFDERLETWALTSERHSFADAMIGSPTAIPAIAPSDRHRIYDPSTQTAYFRGEEYDLGPVIQALRDLGARAAAMAEVRPPRIIARPLRVAIDTMIVDRILATPALLEAIVASRRRGVLRILAPHIVRDQLEATQDPERRARLLAVLEPLDPEVPPTHGFVLDISRLDCAQLEDGAGSGVTMPGSPAGCQRGQPG